MGKEGDDFMSNQAGWGSQAIPYNQEAEEAVLGAILVNPAAYFGVAAFLEADDFFILRHQYIWQALNRLDERHETIDYLTVISALREIDKLAEIGGPAYLTQLINATPTSTHAEAYGRLVERAATRRRLMAASDEIKALALNEELELEQVIDQSGKKLFDASDVQSDDQIVPFQVLVNDYFSQVENLMDNPKAYVGLATEFRELDELLEGLQKGDLYLVAGRPGMGKSGLLLSIALNILRCDPRKRIGYFSLEMPANQLVQRAASIEAGINLQTLRGGKLGDGEWSRFVEAAGCISKYPLFIDDRARLTPRQLRAKVRKLMMGYGRLDLVIVDYVQLMVGGGFKPNERVQEVGYISSNLKSIAKEFDVPVLSAAQLNRGVESRKDKRPMLSDLRESGSLEADADVVIFLYRDEVYNPATEMPNLAEAIVAKHRNGPTGTANLHFEKTLTKFSNAVERKVDLSYLNHPSVNYPIREKD
jgi:replicative DNA helicase